MDQLFGTGLATVVELKSLLEQVKCVVELDIEYASLSKDGYEAVNRSSCTPEREKGLLTDLGREQLRNGMRMCNIQSVMPLGDPMYSRIKSYESEWVVYFFIWV